MPRFVFSESSRNTKVFTGNYSVAVSLFTGSEVTSFSILSSYDSKLFSWSYNSEIFIIIFAWNIQKQPSRGVLRKSCSENMQQIYRRTPMSKCDFNKVAKQCECQKMRTRITLNADIFYAVKDILRLCSAYELDWSNLFKFL